MSIFDYINWVSGYIINRLESKENEGYISNTKVSINPIKDFNTGRLSYEILEKNLKNENVFYSKFAVDNKEEFYNSIYTVLIKYFKNSDLLSYSAINQLSNQKSFTIATKYGDVISFGLEDENDLLIFSQFKTYLDEIVTVKSEESTEKVEENRDVITYKKIML